MEFIKQQLLLIFQSTKTFLRPKSLTNIFANIQNTIRYVTVKQRYSDLRLTLIVNKLTFQRFTFTKLFSISRSKEKFT